MAGRPGPGANEPAYRGWTPYRPDRGLSV